MTESIEIGKFFKIRKKRGRGGGEGMNFESNMYHYIVYTFNKMI